VIEDKSPEHGSGLFDACYGSRCLIRLLHKANIRASGKTMAVEDKKTKSTAAKDPPAVTPAKTADAAPNDKTVKAEKADLAPSNKGMGEGQKPVSQAYKENWNAIFAKKRKR
jgi:hypothetical protein